MSNLISIIEYYPIQKLSDGTIYKESYKEVYINPDYIKYIKQQVFDGKICCVLYFLNDNYFIVVGELKDFKFLLKKNGRNS